MQSRIFGIKKINILRSVAIMNFIGFVASIFVSIYFFRVPKVWFDFFCLFVGNYLLIKSFLYKSDANCYLGFLLFFLGTFLAINTFLDLKLLFIAITFSFALASVATYIFFGQIFHIVYGINFVFWCLCYMLFRQKIINIYIFFLLLVIFIFIFSLVYAKIKIRKK